MLCGSCIYHDHINCIFLFLCVKIGSSIRWVMQLLVIHCFLPCICPRIFESLWWDSNWWRLCWWLNSLCLVKMLPPYHTGLLLALKYCWPYYFQGCCTICSYCFQQCQMWWQWYHHHLHHHHQESKLKLVPLRRYDTIDSVSYWSPGRDRSPNKFCRFWLGVTSPILSPLLPVQGW